MSLAYGLGFFCDAALYYGAAGCFGDFFRGFGLLFASKKYSEEERALYSERSVRALGFGVKATLLAGGCDVLISFIIFLHRLSDPAVIGPYLAIIILTALYACILSLILLVIKERIRQFENAGNAENSAGEI